MKRKALAILLTAAMACSTFVGMSVPTAAAEKEVINLWTFTDEVPGMVAKFKEANPDFPYEIKETIIAIFRLSGERHRWGHENRGAFALSTILNS
jgi:ABC-type glycerol-3-phosphate transport system substrate-binding protein